MRCRDWKGYGIIMMIMIIVEKPHRKIRYLFWNEGLRLILNFWA